MASIYKRPESKIWQCQFYVRESNSTKLRKIRQSTGKSTKDEARKVAAEMERNAQVVMRAGSPQAQQVKAILAKAGTDIERERFTLPAAHKVLAQLVKITTGEEMHNYTLESWSEEWLRRKRRDNGDSTMSRYKKHVASFLDWLGDQRRKKPLESVTSPHLRKWCEDLKDSGLSGVTVKNYAKDIGAMYRVAVMEGVTSFNPCVSVISALDTEDSTSRKPFELDEVKALMKAAPSKEWKGLILVAAFTGLRLSDAVGLLWEKVDLKSERISLIPSKTSKKKREILIPIQEDLLEYFRTVRRDDVSPESPVFPALSKKEVEGATGLSDTFTQRIMVEAAVSRGKASREIKEGESKSKGRTTYERGFHSFRHTFTSWLRNADVSEEDRMALTGHTTRESHKVYSHVEAAKLHVAVSKLPRLKKKQAKAKNPTSEGAFTNEIASLAASLPSGTPDERAKEARLLLEAAERQTQPLPKTRAWFETESLDKIFDEIMPYELAEQRTARYKEFLIWAARQELESERSSRMMDNVIFGKPNNEAEIADEMVVEKARYMLDDQTQNGVKGADSVAEQLKHWLHEQSVGIKS
jgi:integrase